MYLTKLKQLSFSLILLFSFFTACTSKKEIRELDIFYVADFGAVGDGKQKDTKAIQEALNEAGKVGGKVIVSKGQYLIGTIFIPSYTTLELSAEAVLLGSPDLADYATMTWGHNEDRTPYHLVVAKDAKNVTIQGRGTIDGQGKNWYEHTDVEPRWMVKKIDRPSPMVEFENCENVKIRDITLTNAAGWTLHTFNSKQIHIDGIRLINNLYGPNNDGIDVTGCEDVMISNCYVKTCDDAICIKTTEDSEETHNVTVTNCVMQTTCVALKMGETSKEISDITFSNCVITKSSRAFGIYATWGGTISNVLIDNIVCNTNAPLVLNRPFQLAAWDTFDKEGKRVRKGGHIKNVTISNFNATTEGRILITANQECTIENVICRDLILNYPYIENPELYAPFATSEQFRGIDSASMNAKAAFVASNVKGLVVDNLITNWNQSDTIPSEWKHAERIENGKMDKVHKPVYNEVRPVNFHAVYLNNVQGGYIFAPLSTSSHQSVEPIKLINSKIKLLNK